MIYKVTLNGKIYEVEVEKGEAVIQAEYEAALPQATPVAAAQEVATAAPTAAPAVAAPASAGANSVTAPMPGTINAVKVTSGQQVKKGDVLFILEAMKMENEIYADKDGKVGQVFVQKGASVSTGAPLCELN
ncbi:MAG TPA: acetyl-CoA carboxylase biotin carboxyl carrier protein subunit [Clostridiales bacterium]|nr:acetyl-CoA carboxylase biotin carboxyl carrier protein subunit [Clostridiales bacterium]HBW05356.1 acetyl-CoA carboxylase biotin carboxyl carrier protein subunit [Clostridiales bacterium]HCH93248.1 acetyl-CoA carboxylase biotin carboxyl carrier protein subunit [Clostridiales bacterium]